LFYAWLLLVIADAVAKHLGAPAPLVGVAATLTGLWIVLRASTLFLHDALLARVVAMAAWIIAALTILGLLSPTEAALDRLAITIGSVRLSLLLVIKAALIVGILLWAALSRSCWSR
jgi:hypothetical protein